MVRHGRRLPVGVDQDDLYVKNAERLAGGRSRDDEEERREDDRTEHEGHRSLTRDTSSSPAVAPRTQCAQGAPKPARRLPQISDDIMTIEDVASLVALSSLANRPEPTL